MSEFRSIQSDSSVDLVQKVNNLRETVNIVSVDTHYDSVRSQWVAIIEYNPKGTNELFSMND